MLPFSYTLLALVHDRPTFQWEANCNDRFIVEYSLDPEFAAISGWITPILSDPSFTLPQAIWNAIPRFERVYWRVRGINTNSSPIRIHTSDEVWSLRKY